MWQFITFFFIIQLINVVLNTFRTCVTAKGNKLAATIVTAICYGFYTFVIVYTADDFNIWIKAGVTVVTNLIGVWVSMTVLEKLRKDKLWEITATIKDMEVCNKICNGLVEANIGFTRSFALGIEDTYSILNIYCPSQKESLVVKKLLTENKAKYIVHEENGKL